MKHETFAGKTTRLENNVRERFDSLSKSYRKVADHILTNQEKLPFVSARNLAREIGVSESTVLRFIKYIGYNGYPDLQLDLQKWMTSRVKPSQKLKEIANKSSDRDIYKISLDNDIHRIIALKRSLSSEQLQGLCTTIIKAKRKYVFGERTSFAAAYLFSFFLSQLLKDVYLLRMEDSNFISSLAEANKNDVIFVISFPRYSKRTKQIAQMLKNNDCRVIAITDHIISPVGRIADDVIEVETRPNTYFNSFTAVISLINCIIEEIAVKNPKRASLALRKQEELVAYFDMLLT